MRRLLIRLVRWLAEALVRLYYPARIVEGIERIPTTGPLVFVLNHPNGLLDPLVLRSALGRPARFLAKGTLFGNPFGRLAMDAFDTIPIHRAKEAKAGDAARNEESFALCRAELAAGGALALFPEGVSHSDSQLRPLKTGAARIALSAEAEHQSQNPQTGSEPPAMRSDGRSPSSRDANGRLGVTVVPVGLYYERKARFRSSVLLVVGEPIAIVPRLADYGSDERAAVAALTETIDARLDEVVLQAESRELLLGIARVARWTAAPGEAPDDLAAQHERARQMIDAYGQLRARDPARVEAIAAEARAYARALRRLGVRDPWALELAALRPGAVLGALARLALAAPVAALGALMGWIPYRLAGRVAGRITRDEDILGTVKLIAGATFMAIAWTAEALLAASLWGPIWAAPVFGVGLASGYVALWFEEEAGEAVAAWRTLALRAFHWRTTQQLTVRRRALADAVATALADRS